MNESVLWHQLWIDSQFISRSVEGVLIALGCLGAGAMIAKALRGQR